MAGQTFEGQGYFQQLGHLRFFVSQFLELRLLLQSLLQGDIQNCRYQLGDLVHIAVGHIQSPADVADHPLGHHGAKGDNLGDVGLAVLLPHVIDNLFAAIDTEVDVDIRHRHPFRVEEPLKEQVVGHGIDIGDANGIGHQTTRGATTARSHRNSVILGPIDEVGNDQKITGETHGANSFQLDFEAVAIILFLFGRKVRTPPSNLYQTFIETLAGIVSQHFIEGLFLGFFVLRKVVSVEIEFQITALGDGQSVAQSLGHLLEQRGHFLGGFDVEFFVGKPHPVRVVHGLAGLNGQQYLVGVGIFAGQIVAVVGCHQRQAKFPGKLDKPLVSHILLGKEVFLQLEIEPVTVKDTGHFLGAALGIGHLALINQGRNLAAETGGHGDESFVVLGQKLPVDTGLVVETFTVSRRHQVAEITVASQVLAQQHKVMRGFGRSTGAGLVKPGTGRHIDLATEDRLDARSVGFTVKFHGAKHVAVVSHRQGWHLAGHGALDQVADLNGAIEETVLTMKM